MLLEQTDLFMFRQRFGTEVFGSEYDELHLLSMKDSLLLGCVAVCCACSQHVCAFFLFFLKAYSTVDIYVL